MFPINRLNKRLLDRTELTELFDVYRLVNPDTHEVYDYQDGTLVPTARSSCFDIWQRDNPCCNCTSYRALHENKTIVKLECSPSQTFLIDSMPIVIQGQELVLELAKNVDDSLLVNFGDNEDNTDIIHLIARMNTMIFSDSFTGLYNKKYFLSMLPKVLQQSIADKTDYCGAIFDIDTFKRINDTYGHQTGDQVIMFIAEQFKAIADKDHVRAARIGGDEFYLGFDGYGEERARSICKNLCATVKSHRFDKNGEAFTATISYGLVKFDGENPPDISSYLDMIDKQMYEAKRRSRPE
jgi:putative two-component system response regulator